MSKQHAPMGIVCDPYTEDFLTLDFQMTDGERHALYCEGDES